MKEYEVKMVVIAPDDKLSEPDEWEVQIYYPLKGVKSVLLSFPFKKLKELLKNEK